MVRNEIIALIVLTAIGLLAPLLLSPAWMTVFIVFFYYAMLSMSWNIVFGFAGLFSFGHVAFAAIGGYTSVLLAEHVGVSPFFGLVCGGLAAGAVGVLVGALILRVHGFYLCLVTWAFAEVINNVIKTEHEITGGTGGFLTVGFFEGAHGELYTYFLGLTLMLMFFVISATIRHSKWGFYLFAIRDDIDAAESMGVVTRFWKVAGFAFGSCLAGVAGAFYAHYFTIIDSSLAGLDEMGKTCLMVILGGLGTLAGPLLGSFFVITLSELIRGVAAEWSLLIFAGIMILTLRFVRGGMMQIVDGIIKRCNFDIFKKNSQPKPTVQ